MSDTDVIKKEDLSDEEDTGIEMSFLDHLEELRWRLLYSMIGIVIGTIAAWIFIDYLIEVVLLKPAVDNDIGLQNLRPFGQLFLYVQVAIITGMVLSIPNIFFQVWKFISPALKKNERKYIVQIVIFSSFCFIAGIVFAYFIMLPLTFGFAAQFGTEAIKNEFAID